MLIGIDIGGTKCAVIKASEGKDRPEIIAKSSFKTESFSVTFERIIKEVEALMPCDAIGISCGGPLDEDEGVIKSPPNLPGWDNIEIVKILKEKFSVPVLLRNDANASALAENRFGAGRGYSNMVFLTFGTGLGAGIIIDGKLYSGANGNAGEVGHIRLRPCGPVGYGKAGSFEGFCSGGGIAKLARERALTAIKDGKCLFGIKSESELSKISAKSIAALAKSGDADSIAFYREVGEMLGEGLAVIIDTINPDAIVIGSIYERAGELMREGMESTLKREGLKESVGACEILPAELGDSIGDYAALCVALKCKQMYSKDTFVELGRRYPELSSVIPEIKAATNAVVSMHNNGGKVLIVGNGGSAADCEHIAGELLKGFLLKREPCGEELSRLKENLGESAEKLQRGISAIPLPSITGALSAFVNDVEAELAYAQLVYAIGRRGDILIAISTSGNSKNVVAAAECAKALGIKVIALTGQGGGKLSAIADILIASPESETFKVQEHHLPIYHAICAEAEKIIFGR